LSLKFTTNLIRRQNHNGEELTEAGFVFLLHKLVFIVSLVD